MKFTAARESLLKPLNLVAGVVERRQTLPILSNVLLSVEGDQLAITGTDLEVELIGRVPLIASSDDGDITFTGIVGGGNPLGAVTIDDAKDVTGTLAFTAASLTQTAGSGTTQLIGVTTVAGGLALNTATIVSSTG